MKNLEFDFFALERELSTILRNIEEMKARHNSINMDEVRSKLCLLKTKQHSPRRFGSELPPLRRSTSPLFFENRRLQTPDENECRSPISKPSRKGDIFSPYTQIVMK